MVTSPRKPPGRPLTRTNRRQDMTDQPSDTLWILVTYDYYYYLTRFSFIQRDLLYLDLRILYPLFDSSSLFLFDNLLV